MIEISEQMTPGANYFQAWSGLAFHIHIVLTGLTIIGNNRIKAKSIPLNRLL
jgi:hypothetical protein